MHHQVRAYLGQIVTSLLVCTGVIVAAATYHARAQGNIPAGKKSTTALLNIGSFEATVYSGPDRGLSVSGRLRLRATRTGALTGLLVPAHGAAIALSGQLTGYAINLVFYLGSGGHIFGVGTVGQDRATQQAFAGGPLVGPHRGDSGDWDATIFQNQKVLTGIGLSQ